MTRPFAAIARVIVMLALMGGPAFLAFKHRVDTREPNAEFSISFGYGHPPFSLYLPTPLNWGTEVEHILVDASWKDVAQGTEVWVLVAVADDKAKAMSVSLTRPYATPGTVVIRGRVDQILYAPHNDNPQQLQVRVDYGFSEHMFAESALKGLQKDPNAEGRIVFRVLPSGRPVPIAIRIGGEEVWREMDLF